MNQSCSLRSRILPSTVAGGGRGHDSLMGRHLSRSPFTYRRGRKLRLNPGIQWTRYARR